MGTKYAEHLELECTGDHCEPCGRGVFDEDKEQGRAMNDRARSALESSRALNRAEEETRDAIRFFQIAWGEERAKAWTRLIAAVEQEDKARKELERFASVGVER